MDCNCIARRSLLSMTLLLFSITGSITAEMSYSAMVTLSEAKAEAVEAYLVVYASYSTTLEMQWEVNEDEKFTQCIFEVKASSDTNTMYQDCIQSSSSPKRYRRNLILSNYFSGNNSLGQITGVNSHVKASNVEKSAKFEESGRTGTAVSMRRRWKKGGISGVSGSAAAEKFLKREADLLKVMKYFNLTDLDACTAYQIKLFDCPKPNGNESYIYTGEVKNVMTQADETPPKSLLCEASEENVSFSWAPPFKDCSSDNFTAIWTATSLWSDEFENDNETVPGQETSLEITEPLVWAEYALTLTANYADSQSNATTVTCKTPEQKPSAVQNVTVGAMTSDTIWVMWEAPALANGNISEYIIYIENVNETANAARNITVPETSYNITGLDVCETYSITIAAVNGAGQGPPSDSISQTLKEDDDPNLELSCSLHDTSISVEWNSVYRDCKEVSYQLQYSLNVQWESNTAKFGPIQLYVPSFEITGEDFIPGTKYDVNVSAVADTSISGSCSVTSNDAESSPPAITNVSSTPVSIYVEWTPPEKANGVLSAYDITFTDEKNVTYSTSVNASVTLLNYTENIFGCMCYLVAVAAVNSFGVGEMDTSETTTAAAILDVACVVNSSSEILVSWSFSDNTECAQNVLNLTWTGTSLWETNTNFHNSANVAGVDENALVNGLHPYTIYTFYLIDEMGPGTILQAKCTTLEAAPSEPRSFSVAGVTSHSVTLTWQEPESWNGRALGYNLTCSGESFNVTDEQAMLEGLDSEAQYDVFLRACSLGGCSEEVKASANTSPITPDKANTTVIVLSVMAVCLAITAGLVIAIVVRNKRRSLQSSEVMLTLRDRSVKNSSSATSDAQSVNSRNEWDDDL